MTNNKSDSSAPGTGSFTIEHLKELDFLKTYGTVSALNAEEERLLADIAAAGFAKRTGSAYVYCGYKEELRRTPDSPQPDAPLNWASFKNESPSADAPLNWATSAGLPPIETSPNSHLESGNRNRSGRMPILFVGLTVVIGLAITGSVTWSILPRSKTSEIAIFEKVSQSVVQVIVQDKQRETIGSGSGFLVSRTGLIATNYHVIEKADAARIVLADGTSVWIAGVAAFDEKADIAILKVAEKVVAQPLELAGSDIPPVGTKVFAIGNPRGLANTMSDGLVSGHREPNALDGFLQVAVIQTTAPISPGSSGGPLLTADGKVVGVTTGERKDGQNLNFAIPVSNVATLLATCAFERELTKFPLVPQAASACLKNGNERRYKDGDYDKAIEQYSKAIRLHPEFIEAYISRGDTWAEKEDYHKAIKDYDAAIRIDPKNAWPYTNRGDAWMALKEYDRAITDFDDAVRIDPKYVFGYIGCGKVWMEKKEYDKAIREFDAAIRIDPNYAWAHRNRGDAWMKKTEYDKAIKDFDEAIRLYPKSASAYVSRGDAWAKKKNYDKAITDYSESIRLDPQNAFFYISRGDAWTEEKKYSKAIEDFDEAIRLDPKDALAYHYRANASIASKDYDRAINDSKQAMRLDPKNASFHDKRVEIWVAKNDYDNLIEHYSKAIRINPSDASAFNNRGVFWSGKKEFEKAINDLDEAIRLAPKNSWSYLARAKVKRDMKKYANALEDFYEAIRLDPKSEHANGDFAWFLATCPDEKFRDSNRAMPLARKACELTDWKNGSQLEILAAAYAEAGQFDDAERYQRKALEDPECASNAISLRCMELFKQKKPYHQEN